MKHSFLIGLMLTCMSFNAAPIHADITGWDEVGPTITGQIYSSPNIVDESLTAVKKKNKWGFVTPDNKVIIKPKFDAIGDTIHFYTTRKTKTSEPLKRTAFFVKENGKWGVVDFTGKIIIKPEYDNFGEFYTAKFQEYGVPVCEGRAIAQKENSKYLVNTSGKKLKHVSSDIEEVINCEGITLGINKNGEPAIIDSSVPYDVDLSQYGSDGLYITSKIADNRYIYYRPTKEIFTVIGDEHNDNYIHNDIYIVSNKDGLQGVIDDCKFVTELIYGNIKTYRIPNSDSDVLILPKEDHSTDLYYNNKLVTLDKAIRGAYYPYYFYSNPGKTDFFGIMDYEGNIITEPIYTKFKHLEPTYGDPLLLYIGSDPRAIVNNKYKVVELPEGCSDFEYVGGYIWDIRGRAGYAQVDVDNGKFQIPFSNYTHSKAVGGNLSIVSTDGKKWGLVDPIADKVIIPLIYDNIEKITVALTTPAFRVTKNGQCGVINKNGKTVIPLGRYKRIIAYQQNHYIVQNGNKVGLLDTNGKLVVPLSYDSAIGVGSRTGNIMVFNMAPNGSDVYIYSPAGKLLNHRKFSNSDIKTRWYRDYIEDWLGYIMPFDY